MSDMLLAAKPILPEGVIDVSVGEPHVIRNSLLEVFNLDLCVIPKTEHMYEYPSPTGYSPLVKFLEEKHKAPIVITNGAKQGLGACFYALKQMGYNAINMRTPYWALIPQMATMHGLGFSYNETNPYIMLAPNNPDGFVPDNLKQISNEYKERNIPFIHDAAYYTPIYMPYTSKFEDIGDVQIFSVSKMFGLSGLRLGYAVCHNSAYYTLIQRYVEAMTVGASLLSQIFLFNLLNRMKGYPTLVRRFEGMASNSLDASKKIIKAVNPEILDIGDIEKTNGMFGWFKVGPKADFNKSKLHTVSGELFGDPKMIRFNLAFPEDKMQEIVNRLNNV